MDNIDATHMTEQVKDTLEEWHAVEMIPGRWRRMLRSDKKILAAINRADIEVCGLLKPEKQVIVHLPPTTAEVFLRSDYYGQDEDEQALKDRHLPQQEEAMLLNVQFARDASQVRSGYLFV